jgi:hypothetical protein
MAASSSSAPRVDCSGSSSFSVSAPGVTAVPVHLLCREAPVTQPPPPAVPLPPFVPLAICLLLLAAGWVRLGHKVAPRSGAGRA